MNDEILNYTKQDFITFVKKICNDDYETEQEHIDAVLLFEKLTQHPDGSDLIFYPEKPGDDSPERITEIVKEWRESQDLPCFKG
jgi:hypothetical protein